VGGAEITYDPTMIPRFCYITEKRLLVGAGSSFVFIGNRNIITT
jgi:hypothetical protein